MTSSSIRITQCSRNLSPTLLSRCCSHNLSSTLLQLVIQFINDHSSKSTKQSPTLGAHIHAHAHAHPYPWVLGGHGCNVFVHGWASVLCILASSSKLESNFLNAGNTVIKKRSGLKPMTMNDLVFVRSNQDLVYAGNIHYTTFEYMGAI